MRGRSTVAGRSFNISGPVDGATFIPDGCEETSSGDFTCTDPIPGAEAFDSYDPWGGSLSSEQAAANSGSPEITDFTVCVYLRLNYHAYKAAYGAAVAKMATDEQAANSAKANTGKIPFQLVLTYSRDVSATEAASAALDVAVNELVAAGCKLS
jgi:hypothetical protein